MFVIGLGFSSGNNNPGVPPLWSSFFVASFLMARFFFDFLFLGGSFFGGGKFSNHYNGYFSCFGWSSCLLTYSTTSFSNPPGVTACSPALTVALSLTLIFYFSSSLNLDLFGFLAFLIICYLFCLLVTAEAFFLFPKLTLPFS